AARDVEWYRRVRAPVVGAAKVVGAELLHGAALLHRLEVESYAIELFRRVQGQAQRDFAVGARGMDVLLREREAGGGHMAERLASGRCAGGAEQRDRVGLPDH